MEIWKSPEKYQERLNYDLNENSVVVDAGGYRGQWANDIFSKYQCQVFIFEPVPEFAADVRKRFNDNQKIRVFETGLGASDREESFGQGADDSSVWKNGGKTIRVQISDAVKLFEREGIRHIDLMKINIEGGEYELLEHLIETGFIKDIDNLQIQFHDFVPDAKTRMEAIHTALSHTHFPTYQYEFVWENWRRKT